MRKWRMRVASLPRYVIGQTALSDGRFAALWCLVSLSVDYDVLNKRSKIYKRSLETDMKTGPNGRLRHKNGYCVSPTIKVQTCDLFNGFRYQNVAQLRLRRS